MLELRSVSKALGAFRLDGVDLRVRPDEYFVLLGPSGAGKTVLLEIVAGLVRPDAGEVLWKSAPVTGLAPEARGFAVVYQDLALFPRMNVTGNIAFGPRAHGVGRPETKARVRSLAGLVGIEALLDREVGGLSGGEQQRVALARALAAGPRLLLLDEPLSALDAGTRARLRRELRRIHRETGTAFLHVTHDLDEAMYLGDRIAVLLGGRVRQVGTPEEVFRRPSDPAVAEFLGLRNVLAARAGGEGVCRAGGVEIHAASADAATSHVWIKPEEVLLSRRPFDSSARNQFRCAVEGWEPAGVMVAVRVRAGALELAALVTHSSFEDLGVEKGADLYCTFKSTAVHCF